MKRKWKLEMFSTSSNCELSSKSKMIAPEDCQHGSNQLELFSKITASKRLPPPIGYHQLTILNLSNLQLTHIDSFPLACFPKLKNLDLSRNQLKTISPDWAKGTNNFIECLNLSLNKLETLIFLKDFHFLRQLNVTENNLKKNERFLSLYLCSTIETLIDCQENIIEIDRLALTNYFDNFQVDFDRFRSSLTLNSGHVEELFQEFVRSLSMKNDESSCTSTFVEFSPSQIYFLRNQFYLHYKSFERNQFQSTISTQLIEDWTRSLNLNEQCCQLKSLIRCHHHSDESLASTPVWMSTFESNSNENILVTCGGKKVSWTNCDTGEVTHVFDLSTKRSLVDGRKREKSTAMEYFSSICSIEIGETLKIIAAGTNAGLVYLLSSKWKLMFGRIELPGSSIRCLTWHRDDPTTLIVASDCTVRCINIRSYVNRLESFIRKFNQPTVPFDFVDSASFINPTSVTHVYHLNNSAHERARLFITDLLCYSLSSGNNPVVIVATTAGLFVIRYREKKHEQTLIQLALPKPVWTISEHIESLCLIDNSTRLIAMNILGLDRICCFNLEHALQTQQIQIFLSFSNPVRAFPTRISAKSNDEHESNSFQCFVGTTTGSIYHHRIHWRTKSSKYSTIDCQHTYQELTCPLEKHEYSQIPTILSTCINGNYLVCTTSDNLICIYQR